LKSPHDDRWSCGTQASETPIMSRDTERRRDASEYVRELLDCIPLLRELLESLLRERREEEIWDEEWALQKEQYEGDVGHAEFKRDFIDDWR